MNGLQRALLAVAPVWSARRARARILASYYQTAYEATMPGRLRKRWRDHGSGNQAAQMAIRPLRDYARQLERNHDIARGILSILVRNTVGPYGIGVEPQPKDANGEIHDDLAEQLDDLYTEWSLRPEVTWSYDRAGMEQMLCRSWIRDGESLFQRVMGFMASLDHGTAVPYSIEMIEADLLPLEFNDPSHGIFQGVERSAWGRPVAYHLYKTHPADPATPMFPDRKRVGASLIGHLRAVDRIGQVRGVSQFASVLSRLEDIKDYEESERIAAKIAASLAAVIKKGSPELFNPTWLLNEDGTQKPMRELRMQPGMILDNLMPGEDVSMIDSNRPNPSLKDFRNGQVRAVASGTDVSYSAASKDYDGSYSALRQELVDQYSAYATLSAAFVQMCARPIYQGFVSTAILSGQIKVPRGVDPDRITDALFVPPQIPWIDPQKEAAANEILEDRAWASAPDIIRRRGGKPRDVAKQQAAWLRLKEKLGIPTIIAGRQQPETVVDNNAKADA